MPEIVLIKHAKPQVSPEMPSHEWPLSEEGRRQSLALAERLRRYALKRIISSTEPKAAETGRIVADELGLKFQTAPNLHEHDRSNVPHMPTREFLSFMALFFDRDDERVLGLESAREARDRITDAVDHLATTEDGPVGIVTHGTVLALYATMNGAADPFQIWRRMQLPSFIVVDTDKQTILESLDHL